ncbi:putative nuclease HARBI1 [Austrofundulus limnaeus]|uniref:Nuclease HARBI1 n=1 Tax=Austrofundulus limnaeus TaxID=52670 RepID=A0A2I4CEZ3_AUSLI|nr:PREDICTED: putative nuclease HARBI1 [Austrofundulus limnaeus]
MDATFGFFLLLNHRRNHVYIGNTGSVHDALVLRRSPMYKQVLYPPAGFFLLGDGGYHCLQHPVCMMTPYRQPVRNRVEQQYNRHHAKARSIIERSFGMLETRWRSIFLWALEIRPVFAPTVVAACCILHNICKAADDLLAEEVVDGPEDGDDGVEDMPLNADQGLSGNNIRARLAAQLCPCSTACFSE